MAWKGDDVVYSHLFIAAPELLWEKSIIQYLENQGLVDSEALAFVAALRKDTKRLNRIRKRTAGLPLMARLIAVAPEIVNRKLIQMLYNTGHLDKRERSTWFILLRTLKVAKGGLPTSREQIVQRAKNLFGRGMVEDALQLLVATEAIDNDEANKMRAVMIGGKVSLETLQKIRHAKTMVDMLALAGSGFVDKRTIEALRRAGFIDIRTEGALLTAIQYGKAQWTVFEGSRRAEGLAARMAYVVSGSFSFEALDFIEALDRLEKDQKKRILNAQRRAWLEVAVMLSQRVNRDLMERLTDRRFRVVPGEAPIATYARASQEINDDLLKLLAEAADESRRASGKMAGTVRGAEYALNAQALHQAMRRVWEGTGYLAIFHEREVASAAAASAEMLMTKYYKEMKPFAALMMEHQARSGLDSYISRKENTLQLSRRVYGNLNIWGGKVDRAVNLAILQGKSAKEIADSVQNLINPRVMGGVKYAAFRLGRTELANAFHFTTIRHSREMPWVRGYRWNRSSSHKHSDTCDEYANDDHDGLGPGVFKKANVPGKPHPQCMCYVTIVGMTNDEFVKAYKAGRFNAYLNSRVKDTPVKEKILNAALQRGGKFVGRTAGQIAMTQGLYALDNMMHTKKRSPAVNPTRAVVPAKAPRRIWASTIDVEAATMTPEERVKWDRASKRALDHRDDSIAALEARQFKFNDYMAKRSALGLNNPSMDLDKLDYEDILPANSGASGFSDEMFSSTMYGTTAYRTINAKLRQTAGDLKKYDKSFGDLEEFFKNAAALQAHELETFIDLDDLNDLLIEMEEAMRDLDDEDIYFYMDSLRDRIGEFGLPLAIRSHSDVIRRIDEQMERTRGDRLVYRVTGDDWFGVGRKLTQADIGLIFRDDGFTSTEGIPNYYNSSLDSETMLDLRKRPNRVRILLPDGTAATRMNDFEYEILLARGGMFQILDIRETATEMFVDVMLLHQPTLETNFRLLEDGDLSMLETLMGGS